MEMQSRKTLNADIIKYIAVTAMFIDHIARCFVDFNSVPGQIMHILGRITAPIMSFFIAEGFHHTKNIKRYVLRLVIFALISWFPFIYMLTEELPIAIENDRIYLNPHQSMIFTLFLALLSLKIVHNEKMSPVSRLFTILPLIFISLISDWYCLPIIWTLLFDKYRNDYRKQAAAFIISNIIMIPLVHGLLFGNQLSEYLFQFGVLLALPILFLYNGKKGSSSKFNKWFFYVFYPLHITILGLLKTITK